MSHRNNTRYNVGKHLEKTDLGRFNQIVTELTAQKEEMTDLQREKATLTSLLKAKMNLNTKPGCNVTTATCYLQLCNPDAEQWEDMPDQIAKLNAMLDVLGLMADEWEWPGEDVPYAPLNWFIASVCLKD